MVAPRFAVGQRVRARNINPLGHTRLPRYARAKSGLIDRDHGIFVWNHDAELTSGAVAAKGRGACFARSCVKTFRRLRPNAVAASVCCAGSCASSAMNATKSRPSLLDTS